MVQSAYWDSASKTELTPLTGDIHYQVIKKASIYIGNEGNTSMTLSMSTFNWNSSTASNYLTLTWNNGQTISAGTSVPVTLTLTVSPIITGVDRFNFNIIIEGSGIKADFIDNELSSL
jgi:hypothetical protein